MMTGSEIAVVSKLFEAWIRTRESNAERRQRLTIAQIESDLEQYRLSVRADMFELFIKAAVNAYDRKLDLVKHSFDTVIRMLNESIQEARCELRNANRERSFCVGESALFQADLRTARARADLRNIEREAIQLHESLQMFLRGVTFQLPGLSGDQQSDNRVISQLFIGNEHPNDQT